MEGDAGASRLNPNESDDSSSSEVKAEDSAESEDATDQTSTEVKAEDSAESEDATDQTSTEDSAECDVADDHEITESDAEELSESASDAAIAAAKNCVAATQAPDTTAMAASAQKIIDCGSGAFRSQAIMYSSLLVEAYQAANAHVQVSDLRAAVERNDPDGSIVVLVPLRVKVSNSESQNQETGYRLRVTMVSDEGQYRIAKLDQVAR
jgi:Mce-associated membrane protein